MPDNPENSWVPPQRGSPGPADLGPSVPPPPPEVKIRTLKSDLESMSESGGGQPQFKSVKAPVIPIEKKPKSSGPRAKPLSIETGTFVVVLIAIVLLAAIAFFSYQLFFANKAPGLAPVSLAPVDLNANLIPSQSSSTGPSQTPPANIADTSFVHKTYFKKPVDQFLTLTIKTEAQNATDLETFSQKIMSLIAAPGVTDGFLEINLKGVDGRDLNAQKIFGAADIAVIDPQFFTDHFLSDATLFIYKDGSGPWPGFVLGLKPGDNWLFVKNDVGKLETSPKLVNFFLVSPGNADTGGFKDVTYDGQPARILKFTSPSASASFVYGWFHDKLILSTSEEGLKQAIARL